MAGYGGLFDGWWPTIEVNSEDYSSYPLGEFVEVQPGSPSYEAAQYQEEIFSKLLGDFYVPISSSSESSAVPAWISKIIEDNRAAQMAAAVQNQQWQESSAQKVMDFNAEQARLNWERQSQANQIAMDFSAEQAQLNRDFINDQRATAYQTAMADAKAAGLNPILAAFQGGPGPVSGAIGSGVSTGGSAASMQSLPSGSKADTDITTLSHLISNVTSGAFQIGGDLIGILASILTKGKSKVVTGFR